MQKWRKITFYLNEIIIIIIITHLDIFLFFLLLLLPFIGLRRRHRRHSASMSLSTELRRRFASTCFVVKYAPCIHTERYERIYEQQRSRTYECASFMSKIIIIIMKY